MDDDLPFWKRKTMEEMTPTEWESLCDGCGKCCLQTVEDEDTGEYIRLAVACRLLDVGTCRCSDYQNRFAQVPTCVRMTPEVARTADWLPLTCGYRLVARGEELRWWHPLLSGSRETVHLSGNSARGRVVSEEFVDDEEALDYPFDEVPELDD